MKLTFIVWGLVSKNRSLINFIKKIIAPFGHTDIAKTAKSKLINISYPTIHLSARKRARKLLKLQYSPTNSRRAKRSEGPRVLQSSGCAFSTNFQVG